MPAIWNNTTKKGYSSSDNPKESADELWESATGATKANSKTTGSIKQEESVPVKKTLKQRLIENAPAFKRGVDSFITGIATNHQQTTPRKNPSNKIVRRNTSSVNPFSNTVQSANRSFDPFTPINGSNRRSNGPFSGGNFDFIKNSEKSNDNKPDNKRKKARKPNHKHGKSSDNRDIHIHIHK